MPYSLFLIPLLFQFTCPSRSTTGRLYNVMRELLFQFTCPSRSTTTQLSLWHSWPEFQFTCPSRSTTLDFTGLSHFFGVSIHVPLAEHDGGRIICQPWFQFTCPSRSTTAAAASPLSLSAFQFTCPSRSTTKLHALPAPRQPVSIHVPLAEHDTAHHSPL